MQYSIKQSNNLGLLFMAQILFISCSVIICIHHSLCDNFSSASVINGIRHEKWWEASRQAKQTQGIQTLSLHSAWRVLCCVAVGGVESISPWLYEPPASLTIYTNKYLLGFTFNCNPHILGQSLHNKWFHTRWNLLHARQYPTPAPQLQKYLISRIRRAKKRLRSIQQIEKIDNIVLTIALHVTES